MRRFIAAICACIFLAGCTKTSAVSLDPSVPYDDQPTQADTGYATQDVDERESTVTPPLNCLPPTPWIFDWAHERFGDAVKTNDDLVMVYLGEGNSPGSDWWLVVYQLFDTTIPHFDSYVTDAPSLEDPATATWFKPVQVDWTGERLTRLDDARNLAFSCLKAEQQ